MPPDPNSSRKTQTEIDSRTHTITLIRAFSASVAQVFEAWTRPEIIACWWDPSGQKLAKCEVDLRPGGRFLFQNAATAAQSFNGIYREIVPPERLVFDALGAIGTVLLEQRGETTRLTVSIQCRSAEHLEQFLRAGVDTGTAQTLDNLVDYFAQRNPRSGLHQQ